MKGLFDYLAQNPLWTAILILLIILMIVMFVLASKSGKKRQAERERIIAKLEKEKAIRQEYRTLTEKSFEADNEKLLFGVAANIQIELEKEGDMTAAFNELPEYKQYIYALNYVFEDSEYTSLSTFFRCNGQPLTGTAARAVRNIAGDSLSEIFEPMYNMFDDDNEEVSFDESQINVLDEKFRELMENEKSSVLQKIADYIRQNKENFLSV